MSSLPKNLSAFRYLEYLYHTPSELEEWGGNVKFEHWDMVVMRGKKLGYDFTEEEVKIAFYVSISWYGLAALPAEFDANGQPISSTDAEMLLAFVANDESGKPDLRAAIQKSSGYCVRNAAAAGEKVALKALAGAQQIVDPGQDLADQVRTFQRGWTVAVTTSGNLVFRCDGAWKFFLTATGEIWSAGVGQLETNSPANLPDLLPDLRPLFPNPSKTAENLGKWTVGVTYLGNLTVRYGGEVMMLIDREGAIWGKAAGGFLKEITKNPPALPSPKKILFSTFGYVYEGMAWFSSAVLESAARFGLGKIKDVGGWMTGAAVSSASWFKGAGVDTSTWALGAGADSFDFLTDAGLEIGDYFERVGVDTASTLAGLGSGAESAFEDAWEGIEDTFSPWS